MATSNAVLYDEIQSYTYETVWKHTGDPELARKIAEDVRGMAYAGLSPKIASAGIELSIADVPGGDA